jgi:cytochrome-b5 reductase
MEAVNPYVDFKNPKRMSALI